MHGVDSDHGVAQAKRAEQGLHRGYLVGFIITLQMSQHQIGIDDKGGEYVRRAAVQEVVEAVPQGFSINRHETLASNTGIQCGSMAAKRRFHAGGVELTYDTADRGVSWGFALLRRRVR
jgi:hypothetical protein